MNNELQHHGVKGQKWGVRRFQNADGSLTNEGRKRYSDDDFKNAKKTVETGKEVVGKAKKGAEEGRQRVNKKAKEDTEAAVRERAYKMSDDELRAAVNRINMEERYAQVMRDREHVEVGKSKAEKFMDYTLTALNVAGTALTIAVALKELQK